MDKWQREYIVTHKPTLIEQIECHGKLLAILEAKAILGISDVETLKCRGKAEGKLEQSALLLDILCSRLNGYASLGAFILLLQGFLENKIDKPFLRCQIPLKTQQLLSQLVNFQGIQCTLQDVAHTISESQWEILLYSTLDANIYSKLISSKLKLVEDTVPCLVPYYINRSLSIRNQLDSEAFSELSDDVFLIRNIEPSQLTKLAMASQKSQQRTTGNSTQNWWPAVFQRQNNALTDISRNQLSRITCRFIELEVESHYYKIAETSSTSVHWIQFEKGNYTLVTTNHGFERVGKYVTKTEKIFTQDDFLEHISQPRAPNVICISDSPGMGKSILLAEIARNIKRKYPTRLVLFFNLPQFITRCCKKVALQYDKIKDELVSLASANPLGQEITRQLLSSPFQKTELLLDGFDEILPQYMKIARSVLKTILKESENTRMYVTTRPHMRHILEETLSRTAYNILPFQKSDQVTFLVQYWKSHCIAVDQQDIWQKLASSCLSHLVVRDHELSITGIPLQCRILAEVYLNDIKLNLQAECNSGEEIIIADPIRNIYEMYRRYTEMCFNKVEKSDRDFVVSFHMYEAMKILFPKCVTSDAATVDPFKLFVQKASDSLDNNQDMSHEANIFRIGLMEPGDMNGDPQFLHRTYAEFLAAKLLASSIHNENYFKSIMTWLTSEDEIVLLFETALCSNGTEEDVDWKFANPTTAYFLNEHLKFLELTKSTENFPLILKNNLKNNNDPVKLYEKICCSLFHDFHAIFIFLKQLLLNSIPYKNSGVGGELLCWDALLDIATRYSSFQLFQDCCELLETLTCKTVHDIVKETGGRQERESKKIKERYLITALHVASHRGNYQIFEYLVNGCKNLLAELKFILHACVLESYEDSEDVVKNKIQIIKTLVNLHKDCLEEKTHLGPTPLLLQKVHIKLLECLILEGANVFAATKENKNVAYITAEYLNADEYHNLVVLLIDREGSTLFNYAVVQQMLQKSEVKSETLYLLSQHTKVAFHHDVLFMDAIKWGRGKDTLEGLVQLGADVKVKDCLIWGCTLIVAVEHCNVEALRFLILKGLSVNTVEFGQNALHFVALGKIKHSCEMGRILLENHIKVNMVDFDGKTPLDYAKESRNDELVDLLIENGGKSAGLLASLLKRGVKCSICLLFWALFSLLFSVMGWLLVRSENGHQFNVD